MCTSLTKQRQNGDFYLARTMDFPTTSPWLPTFIPRRYAYRPATEKHTRTTKYAFIGGGRQITPAIHLMADGINEQGLACAELYFPFKATYHEKNQPHKLNLTPQDFINWVLGEHGSVAEVRQDLTNIALVASTWFDGAQKVYPFHWILTDLTGETFVLEPKTLTLQLQKNPLGVLTNTPDLNNHLTRLKKFLELPATATLQEIQQAAHRYSGALPAQTIPTDRFIRMAVLKNQVPLAFEPRHLFACLDQVIIPKKEDVHLRNHDYTHYEMVLNLQKRHYTFHDLNTQKWYQLDLADYLESPQAIVFS